MKSSIGLFVFLAVLAVPLAADAQSGGAFGIGPRVTFQRGEEGVPDSSALRLFGGQLRMRLTPKTAIEVSADYDSQVNESLTQRAKSMPIQASLLYFPAGRSVISPYVLGGVGWFRHSLTQNSTTTTIREMGYHAGLGAELSLGARMAIHGDYRYNHIRFGGPGETQPQAVRQTPSASTGATAGSALSPVRRLTAIQESLKLSNGGSMWNWGVTFFF